MAISSNDILRVVADLAQQYKPSTNTAIPKTVDDFAQNIIIRSGDRLVPFTLYNHQKQLLDLIDQYRGVVAIKSRQMGFSQALILRFLHKACLNPAYSALIFSKTQNDTSLLARRCREMITSLNGLVTLETDSLQTLKIAGGGILYFRNSTVNGARGIDSVSDVLYDEAAFCQGIEELYGATEACQAMVGDNARTIIISTPDGMSGWYYDRVMEDNPKDIMQVLDDVRNAKTINEAIQSFPDTSGMWAKYIAHWRAHPLYSQYDDYLEYVASSRKLPMSQVRREYDLSFTDSTSRVFNFILVQQACIEEWEKEYDQYSQYYMGIDTSLQGADYCVCIVAKYDKMTNEAQVVDMYRRSGQPAEVNLSSIYEMICKYNPFKVAVETNSAGQIYLEQLEKMNLLSQFVPIVSTQTSKQTMVQHLILLMETKRLRLPKDRIVKEELLSFEQEGKQLRAIEGKHDDIVMALMFLASVIPDTRYTPLINPDILRLS